MKMKRGKLINWDNLKCENNAFGLPETDRSHVSYRDLFIPLDRYDITVRGPPRVAMVR